MKSYDYEAVVYDGMELCVECLPEGVSVTHPDVSPIFADSELDRPVVCDKCHAEHDYMQITGDREKDDGEDGSLATTLDKAFCAADNENVDDRGALRDVLAALDTRYREAELIAAIAAYWRRSPELFINRLREAGMEVR